MNTIAETPLNGAEEKVDTTGQEQKAESEAALVELGKVSDTRGGFWGKKPDNGVGFAIY